MILDVKSLSKIYGGKGGIKQHEALRGIDFTVEEGEFTAIMGPSGSGKTTLLNILGGLDAPTTGHVVICGKDIANIKKNDMASFRRDKLGFVFQDFNLLDSLTLKENIMLPLVFEDREPSDMEKKSDELMKLMGIYEVKDKYPYSVSGGEQQRTAICRALINEPVIVYADEPTGNLDSKSSRVVMDSLQKMNKDLKTTILMVTHDATAASFTNRVVFIKDGRVNMEIIRKGDRKEFLEQIYNCLSLLGGERVEA